jgi:hypothetical protein
MALIAESELTISGPIDAVFSQFVDYSQKFDGTRT